MAIAGFMILTQLGIAPQIVLITYGALIGMLALAGALAFGLGGREVAAQMWQQAYDRGRTQTAQTKTDLQTGRDRANDQVRQLGMQDNTAQPAEDAELYDQQAPQYAGPASTQQIPADNRNGQSRYGAGGATSYPQP